MCGSGQEVILDPRLQRGEVAGVDAAAWSMALVMRRGRSNLGRCARLGASAAAGAMERVHVTARRLPLPLLMPWWVPGGCLVGACPPSCSGAVILGGARLGPCGLSLPTWSPGGQRINAWSTSTLHCHDYCQAGVLEHLGYRGRNRITCMCSQPKSTTHTHHGFCPW